MNTFLDDQPESAGQHGGSQGEEVREAQAPLLLQDLQSPQEAFGLPKSNRRSQQAVVAVLLVIGAVGIIFAMRQFGLGPAVSLAGIDVEYKPEQPRTGLSPKQVLADLERSRKAVQVPQNLITKDPFELLASTSAVSNEPEIDADAITRAEAARRAAEEQKAREARQKEVQTALSHLELQSVMDGSVPMARISGQIVKVGMMVDDLFEVTAISGREVTLTVDDKPYVLSLEISRSGQKGGSKGRN
ncbi:MAG: hypothetical protein IPJ41_01840 [Phycisphaerales bacterium]|nr:hypothetical protein [Phycisphaerales bacterium]